MNCPLASCVLAVLIVDNISSPAKPETSESGTKSDVMLGEVQHLLYAKPGMQVMGNDLSGNPIA